jgi:ubiquinone/menaquinone biosynthesis C-methylase UbiE
VVGADASATMLRGARGRSDHLVQADLCRTLPFADDAFDAVVSLNVLYTLSDPDAALSEFRRVLKPNGLLRLATPVTGALAPLVREHVRTAGPRELARSVLSIPRLAAWMLMLTIRRAFEGSQFTFRSEEELIDLVEAAGFEIISAEPCYAGIDRMVVARKPS